MGFKDANWAAAVEGLPAGTTNPKPVLLAICLRTDDKTHATIVGHETVAGMLGVSSRTVSRSVGILERLGVLTRERRYTGGFRTSDRMVVDTSWSTSPDTQSPDSVSPDTRSPDSLSSLTGHGVGANKTTSYRSTRGSTSGGRDHPIPDGFTVTASMQQWANDRCPFVDVPYATERFINYWQASGAKKRDWVAAWRNWLLKDQKDASQNQDKGTPMQRVQRILSLVPNEPEQLELTK